MLRHACSPSADECSSRDVDMTQATVLDHFPWSVAMLDLNMSLSGKVVQSTRKLMATKTISVTVDSRSFVIRARSV